MNIAVIPARAGSKSIVNKNLQKLKGETLVDIAVSDAIESGLFKTVVVSTDIPVVLEDYKKHTHAVVDERPESLCQDSSTMLSVMDHICKTVQAPSDAWVWLLQPTTPFRNREDFLSVQFIINEGEARSIISVKDVGPNHPNRMYTIRNNTLKPYRYTNFKNKQELMPFYIRNGAFYVFHLDTFRKEQDFYLHPCVPYLMPEERSVNIDGPMDLALARLMASEGSHYGIQ